MKLIEILRHLPAWAVLAPLLLVFVAAYYIRPDNVTEAAIGSLLSALLLSLNPNRQPQTESKPDKPTP